MKNLVLILGVLFLLLGCSKKENPVDCDRVIISYEHYLNGKTDGFYFEGIELLSDGCLKVSIRYGGGCGSVSAQLVDSGAVLESKPAQRKLRLLFTDNDECEALTRSDFYFDITDLKIDSDNKVLLNFENTDLTILYAY